MFATERKLHRVNQHKPSVKSRVQYIAIAGNDRRCCSEYLNRELFFHIMIVKKRKNIHEKPEKVDDRV